MAVEGATSARVFEAYTERYWSPPYTPAKSW